MCLAFQVLKAKCESDVYLELINMRTGMPEAVPGLEVAVGPSSVSGDQGPAKRLSTNIHNLLRASLLDMSEGQRRSDRKRTQNPFHQPEEAPRKNYTKENQQQAARAHEAAVAAAYEPLRGLKQLSEAGGGEGARLGWCGQALAHEHPALLPLCPALRRLPPSASAPWTLSKSTETPIRCAWVPRA
jgi:hypothetical protein